MKQLLFLFISLLAVSCSKNPVQKPDPLLEEEVMVDIIYDISLIQAIEGSMPNRLLENNIKPDQFIFEKYKIDSTIYRQNQLYYAADARIYKRIYKKVAERLEQNKIKNSNGSPSSAVNMATEVSE
ncbi:DUF4296 domain-containing protein [Flavobacterium sp. HXWNR69]|jgi:hypothetical protein|uniref:DUF4296 domain-containing protein n=1 Tax=Flavobacterium fragile TaxID=2949085 RepID=A0ABT0TCV7_9FLAO|nr:DUF4296 domain-containing protein [Flavobacterium sp. HXWNR69]MCL9768802.1 DUF4296 domain-containing protein [Flavobacterium sp. HXWNR69]